MRFFGSTGTLLFDDLFLSRGIASREKWGCQMRAVRNLDQQKQKKMKKDEIYRNTRHNDTHAIESKRKQEL